MEDRYTVVFFLSILLSAILNAVLRKIVNPLARIPRAWPVDEWRMGTSPHGQCPWGSRPRNVLIKNNIPVVGGISFAIVFLFLPLLISCLGLTNDLLVLFWPCIFMFLCGLLDDFFNFSIPKKFIGQLISAFLLILPAAFMYSIPAVPRPFGILIAIFWVLGITNAFNHLDIVDGVSAAAGAVVSFSFFIVSVLANNQQTASLSIALFGIMLGFLMYNFPPARVYMGNSGSHFLGFILAQISLLLLNSPPANARAISLSLILILGFPILDTAFLVFARAVKKKSIFKKSRDHLTLRLLQSVHSKSKVVFIVFLLCGIFCALGLSALGLDIFWGWIFIAGACLISAVLSLQMIKAQAGT